MQVGPRQKKSLARSVAHCEVTVSNFPKKSIDLPVDGSTETTERRMYEGKVFSILWLCATNDQGDKPAILTTGPEGVVVRRYQYICLIT